MAKLDKAAVWQRTDGGVSITYFDDSDVQEGETEQDMMDRLIARLSPMYPGATVTFIDTKDIPANRDERNEWSLDKISKKVFVDPVKQSLKQTKKDERDSILGKLKITEDELRKIIK